MVLGLLWRWGSERRSGLRGGLCRFWIGIGGIGAMRLGPSRRSWLRLRWEEGKWGEGGGESEWETWLWVFWGYRKNEFGLFLFWIFGFLLCGLMMVVGWWWLCGLSRVCERWKSEVEVWASKDGRGRKLLSEGYGSFLIQSLFWYVSKLHTQLRRTLANSVCGVVEVRWTPLQRIDIYLGNCIVPFVRRSQGQGQGHLLG